MFFLGFFLIFLISMILINFIILILKSEIYNFKLGVSRVLFNIVDINDQNKLKSFDFMTRNSLCKERRS